MRIIELYEVGIMFECDNKILVEDLLYNLRLEVSSTIKCYNGRKGTKYVLNYKTIHHDKAIEVEKQILEILNEYKGIEYITDYYDIQSPWKYV